MDRSDIPTPEDMGLIPSGQMAYVRRIRPEEIKGELPPGVGTLFAVFDEEGNHIAVLDNRRDAFALARQHDLTPQSVH